MKGEECPFCDHSLFLHVNDWQGDIIEIYCMVPGCGCVYPVTPEEFLEEKEEVKEK